MRSLIITEISGMKKAHVNVKVTHRQQHIMEKSSLQDASDNACANETLRRTELLRASCVRGHTLAGLATLCRFIVEVILMMLLDICRE
jgi:hypothetical protein